MSRRSIAEHEGERRTRLLKRDVVREEEGKIMATRDEPEPLIGRASLEVALHVAAEVEGVAAEVGDREDRDLNVAELVSAASVVRVVQESVAAIVDGLVGAELLELLGGDDTLEAFGSCKVKDQLRLRGSYSRICTHQQALQSPS